MFAFGVLQFPIWAVIQSVRTSKKSMWTAIKESTKPIDWGPSDLGRREEWKRFKEDAKERRLKEVETSEHSYWKIKLFILLGKYKT